MRWSNAKKLISWILIYELSGSSIVFAEEAKKDWSSSVAGAMQTASGIMGNIFNQMQMQQQAQIQQSQLQQKMQWMDPTNCGTKTNYVRCVDDKFPECPIMKTHPNVVQASVCTDGIMPGDPQGQLKFQELAAYAQFFNGMKDAYKNYSSEANKDSGLGIDCVANRIEQVNQMLVKREQEIDNLISKIQKQQEIFKKQAEKDLTKIKDAQSLLEGKNAGSFADSTLAKNSIDFANTFNDPACNSVLAAGAITETGASSGLIGLQAKLTTMATESKDGGYSAMDFDKVLRTNMEKDIMKMADDVSKNFESNNLDSIDTTSANSTYGFDKGISFTSSIKDTSSEITREKKKIESELDQALGGTPSTIKTDLFNSSSDFNKTLSNFEKQTKNACWNNNEVIKLLQKDYVNIIGDPTLSKSANREMDSPFKTKIDGIINNANFTLEEKLAQIRTAETSDGGKNKFKLSKTIVIGNTEIAPIPQKISSVISQMVDNCNGQFDNNPLDSGLSAREMMQKARGLRGKFELTKSTAKSKLKNDIVKRLINCPDSSQANATATGKCTSSALAPSSNPNFCLNQAFACATNMRSCLGKAKEKVAHVTKLRDESVGRYARNIEKNKMDLMKMYAMTEQIANVDGLKLGSYFKKGSMTLPTTLKWGEKASVPGLEKLDVENIDTYTDQMVANLGELKKAMEKQKEFILNGSDTDSTTGDKNQGLNGHLANLKKNHEAAKGEVEGYAAACTAKITEYKAAVAAANAANAKAAQEQAAQVGKICTRYNALATNPTPGCGDAGELADEMAEIAAFSGNTAAIGNLKKYEQICNRYNSDDSTDEITIDKFMTTKNTNLKAYCTDHKSISACGKYLRTLNTWTTTCEGKTEVPTSCILTQTSLDKDETEAENAILATISSDPDLVDTKSKVFQAKLKEAGANNLGENAIAACAAGSNSPQNDWSKTATDLANLANINRNLDTSAGINE